MLSDKINTSHGDLKFIGNGEFAKIFKCLRLKWVGLKSESIAKCWVLRNSQLRPKIVPIAGAILLNNLFGLRANDLSDLFSLIGCDHLLFKTRRAIGGMIEAGIL